MMGSNTIPYLRCDQGAGVVKSVSRFCAGDEIQPDALGACKPSTIRGFLHRKGDGKAGHYCKQPHECDETYREAVRKSAQCYRIMKRECGAECDSAKSERQSTLRLLSVGKARSGVRRELLGLDRTTPSSRGRGAKCAPSQAAGREMPHDYAIVYRLDKHTSDITITPHSNTRPQ